jgi:phage shock protein C
MGQVQPWAGVVRRMGMELHNRMYRSRSERMLAGVAGGLGHYFDIDPTIVRLAFVLALFATGPLAVLLYVVCALIMPREPETSLV